VIGALIDSNRPEADDQVRSLQTAAQTLGRQIVVAKVAAEGEFDILVAVSDVRFRGQSRHRVWQMSTTQCLLEDCARFLVAGFLGAWGNL